MTIPALLAERDIGTYIVTAIFILAWVAGAVSQMINKYREWKARQTPGGVVPRAEVRTGPPPVPLEVAAERARLERERRKQAARFEKQQSQQRQRAQPKAGADRRPARVRTAILTPPALPVRQMPVEEAPVAKIPTPPAVGPSVRAAAAARPVAGLLRAERLREQFILTEILQRPVALREDHL